MSFSITALLNLDKYLLIDNYRPTGLINKKKKNKNKKSVFRFNRNNYIRTWGFN
jgi:hypothetical protein